MSANHNLFDTIAENGNDEGYVPRTTRGFRPTSAPAGSWEKIEELRRRVEHGWPLWHELDEPDYAGEPSEW
jgi:hypothetical protein